MGNDWTLEDLERVERVHKSEGLDMPTVAGLIDALRAERLRHEKLLSECERILPKAERHIDSIPALQAALDAERAAHAELKEFHEHVAGANEAKRRQIEHLSSELLTEEAAHAETKAKLQTARADALEEAAKRAERWCGRAYMPGEPWEEARREMLGFRDYLRALAGDKHE